MKLFKLTPLTRLTMAFEAELNLMEDPEREKDLAGKYLARLSDAAQRRDSTLKGLVILDGLLAVAASGRNITIPGVNLSMADIPAVLEVLTGMASGTAYICAFSFITWLCYSQIHFTFCNRVARQSQIDPDLLAFAETTSEPTLKMFRRQLNIWGDDWHTSTGVFNGLVACFGVANNLFFLMAPLLHGALMYYALRQIVERSGFDAIHLVFYAWVILAHVVALFMWLAPSISFAFKIGPPSAGAKGTTPVQVE